MGNSEREEGNDGSQSIHLERVIVYTCLKAVVRRPRTVLDFDAEKRTLWYPGFLIFGISATLFN
jgi:hypothetical protein